jgi:FixJ family two-component response regulator
MLNSLPIVALTAEIGVTIREEAMQAGATHFLNKPAKGQVLIPESFSFYVNFE